MPIRVPAVLLAMIAALLLGGSTPGRVQAAPADRLVVASYNIRSGAGTWNATVGPFTLPHVPWNRHKHLDRIAEFLEEEGVDLVGLQETQSKNLRSMLVDQPAYLGEKLGLHHRTLDVQKALGGAVDRTGIAVLTRWEVLEHREIRLDTADQGSQDRMAQLVRLAHPAFPDGLWLVNTHMQGGDANPPQMKRLMAAIDEISGAVIVTGDFNVAPGAPGVKAILGRTGWSHRFRDAVREGGGDDQTSTPNGTRRIDHVLISGDLRAVTARVARDTEGDSDHYPVLVELALGQAELAEETPPTPVADAGGGLFGLGD